MATHRARPGWLLALAGICLATALSSAFYSAFAQGNGSISWTSLQDVGIYLKVSYLNTTTNSRTGQMRTNLVVANVSNKVVGTPLVLVVESISAPGVTLANPSGLTPAGKPYINVTGSVGADGILSPGESSAAYQLIFNNPSRVRFTFEGKCFGVVALSVPPAPTLSTYPKLTKQNSVSISGQAPGAASVEISGPLGLSTAAANATGAFTANVALSPNKLNHLFFTAIGSTNLRSPPTAAMVTHDAQPPSVQIQVPIANATITTAATDVAGFVADALSGFEGLTVSVNGLSAEVDIGIGTNGSFFVPNVPLALGSNVISATASDVLGNSVSKQITVTRVEVPAASPKMQVVSGNGQSAQIETQLANPIVVKVVKGDGTPFPDKVVSFTVIHSNGRLSADGQGEGSLSFQTKTDAAGLASARWRVGSDAGCGNNRVEVTSKDIVGTTLFCANALPGVPDQINIGTGNFQIGEAGAPAPLPLVAWLSDGCNGVGSVPVTFVVTEGGGRVNGQQSITVNSSQTGHAQVNFTFGIAPGNNRVTATFSGNPSSPAVFVLQGVARVENAPTKLAGIVLDNASNPIGGARCTLQVNGQVQPLVFSNAEGRFEFSGIPDGSAHLHVDGGVANLLNGSAIPPGSFPALAYELVIIPNAENSLSMPVLLPALNPNNAVSFNNTQDVVLKVQEIEGLQMIVKAGSMKRADGSIPSPSSPAILSLNQVHHDDVPMPMPDGAAPPFAWTLQPGGATFDPPIQICYPNMSGLQAGAASFFLSFNHDTGKFEIVAPGRVSDDGSAIKSLTGTGISVAGWGCNCPPYSVTATCESCGDSDEMASVLYDTGGRIVSKEYRDGSIAKYAYDSQGRRLSEEKNLRGELLWGKYYDERGRMVEFYSSNSGQRHLLSYRQDGGSELTVVEDDIAVTRVFSPSGQHLATRNVDSAVFAIAHQRSRFQQRRADELRVSRKFAPLVFASVFPRIPPDWANAGCQIATDVVALLFLVAGIRKLFGVAQFRQSLLHIPYMKAPLSHLIARTLPPVELAISAGLFMDGFLARIAAIVLLLLFCAVVLVARKHRVRVPCNCFGAESSGYLSGETIRRNLLLASLLLPALVSNPTGNSIVAVLGGAYMIFLALSASSLFQIYQSMRSKRNPVVA